VGREKWYRDVVALHDLRRKAGDVSSVEREGAP
jgi:hypothetical protein